ncbi:hypothetical protein AB1N83_012580 [Pleurotus pulmonarius]
MGRNSEAYISAGAGVSPVYAYSFIAQKPTQSSAIAIRGSQCRFLCPLSDIEHSGSLSDSRVHEAQNGGGDNSRPCPPVSRSIAGEHRVTSKLAASPRYHLPCRMGLPIENIESFSLQASIRYESLSPRRRSSWRRDVQWHGCDGHMESLLPWSFTGFFVRNQHCSSQFKTTRNDACEEL